jgi:beta-lactamase superfamily II metal-dependent hydrolase
MDALRVRVYNVRFGDAILVSIPDSSNSVPKLRHILIDIGNALNKEGGQDFVFAPVITDIQAAIGAEPIDLYIMTHEHLDHVQGLYYGHVKEQLSDLNVDYAWMTASAQPGYYDRAWPEQDEDGNPMPTPKQALDQLETTYAAIRRYAEARKSAGQALPPRVQAMMLNNDTRSTKESVDYLRGLARERTSYVYRGFDGGDLSVTHPFEVANFEVWAPEENTAVYYGHFRPMALGLEGAPEGGPEGSDPPHLATPKPPQGVDVGAFYKLVEARRRGLVENLLAIDKAKNNSSIVFRLEWRGWKLLFAADAEARSWKEMDKRGVLSPVHFLKVSHHASHNGTPVDGLLQKILPDPPPDARQRVAVVSTYPDTYAGVPDPLTMNRLEGRGVTTFTVFEELGDPVPVAGASAPATDPVIGYLEFAFPEAGHEIEVRAQVLPAA